MVYDHDPDAVEALAGEGTTGTGSLAELAETWSRRGWSG